jgi:hypothetical protein
MVKTKATVHGAVSLVNAISNQKGATLGNIRNFIKGRSNSGDQPR